jgi:hypothetical protein
MRRGRFTGRLIAGIGAMVAGWPAETLAQGCAMCKTALDNPTDPTAHAFNVSTLFLMAMPYTIVGTVGAWIYLTSRRQRSTTEHHPGADPGALPKVTSALDA